MKTSARRTAAVVAAGIGIFSLGMPSASADSLPAGIACPGFALQFEGVGGNRQVHDFTDENGVGRIVTGGTGASLTFTNLSTGKTLTLPSNGSTSKQTVRPDKSSTNVITGHTILILFPTDKTAGGVPPGPSTSLIVGRVVFENDGAGNFTLTSTAGRVVDICAALS
ncbi:MAG: hypothetical protein QOJ32_3131 [Frankiaceae bacterium]|nr:hypothetical protein [Frankiaceae bacterium]